MADPAAPPAAIELRGIWKRYGSTAACAGVDLQLRAGEVTGLLGENGAGKSTLMNVLAGVVRPDAGAILHHGRPVDIPNPGAAADLGIGFVHQHLSLIDELPVWENVALGDTGRIDRDRLVEDIEIVSDRYGLNVDPIAKVSNLTAGQRQRVELVKCLRRRPEVLILDEPTSMLAPRESSQLFDVLRRLVREEQRAVVLISHRLEEVLDATDQVTIMRSGRVVARRATIDCELEQLAHDMVGGALAEVVLSSDAGDTLGPIACDLSGLTVTGRSGPDLIDLDLTVRSGEIVGLAGVDGNGQTTIVNVLSGLVPLDSGEVRIGGDSVPTGVAGAMVRAGVAVVPEDRHTSGVVLDMSIAENLALHRCATEGPASALSRKDLRQRAEALMGEYGVVAASPDQPLRALSGGNQQRVVIARELSMDPKVLVAAQPSRGLDVGAINFVKGRILDAARSGVAVLLISSELEELLSVSHRVAVVQRGRVIGELDRDQFDIERLGQLMGGAEA